ncbi:MAG: DUF4358 domain-containing protein, partial [Ruminiclostridium sp.]|nr:DUF4358 domain-containing protein [Ruminiclostridium sp.]
MKKIVCAVLLCAMIAAAAGCGNQEPAATTKPADTTAATQVTVPAATDAKASEITKAVLEVTPINSAFEKKFESIPDYFDGLDTGKIEDSSYFICASGAYPYEIDVFRFDSSDSAKAAVSAVKDRLQYQKDTYKDYTPEEYYKL